MTGAPWNFERWLDGLVEWADTRDDVRALVVVGSRARDDRPADEWSDLDCLLVTTDPDSYRERTDWLDALGDVWLTFREETATGDRVERRALFAPGVDVDFVPVSAEEVECVAEVGSETFVRGYRVVYDEMGATEVLADHAAEAEPERTAFELPDAAGFREHCEDCWYHAVWTAKKLRRGELWTAKGCLDGYLKWKCLLPLLGWHARARHGREPWYDGRFLEEWANERALVDLESAYATYDREDCWRALFATMNLLEWLSEEVADELDYESCTDGQRRASELVETLFEGRESAAERS